MDFKEKTITIDNILLPMRKGFNAEPNRKELISGE
jgi:hypothetical protein